jgi:predicted alpha/beta superfamily hydrolase
VIVVGVPNTERRRDLTGPTRLAKDSAIAPHVGGSAAFRRFFRDELIPAIDRRYRTTTERAIVGESLAGLFVVEAFLREPGLFDHYVAFDPSLWWNQAALVDSSRQLIVSPAIPARRAARRAYRRSIYFAGSRDDIGNNTARLAAVLRAVAPLNISWTYVARPDLTHGNIFRALAPRALAEALR